MTAPKSRRGVCRACGCTDDRACPGGCFWANLSHTICSLCALGRQGSFANLLAMASSTCGVGLYNLAMYSADAPGEGLRDWELLVRECHGP